VKTDKVIKDRQTEKIIERKRKKDESRGRKEET
jgi:hypothetical protein